MPFVPPTLRLSLEQYETIVAHCYDGFPLEACGLLAGPTTEMGEFTGEITAIYPCANADASARTYKIAPKDRLRAQQEADANGNDVIGVWHSHTHTEAYPSQTDLDRADHTWIYVIVSLKHPEPVLRAYRMRGGETHEVDVEVPGLA